MLNNHFVASTDYTQGISTRYFSIVLTNMFKRRIIYQKNKQYGPQYSGICISFAMAVVNTEFMTQFIFLCHSTMYMVYQMKLWRVYN